MKQFKRGDRVRKTSYAMTQGWAPKLGTVTANKRPQGTTVRVRVDGARSPRGNYWHEDYWESLP